MKIKIIFFVLFISFVINLNSQDQINPIAVELSRTLSKDLFDSNGVAIMQPSVEILNAVSNSGFFYTAKVKDDDKFHFRFSFNMMTGSVPSSFQTFNPQLLTEEFDLLTTLEYYNVQTGEIIDTIGLANYLFKTLLHDGVASGAVVVPDESATLLGKPNGENITIAPGSLERLARERFEGLKSALKTLAPNLDLTQIEESEQFIVDILNSIPPTFSLTQGGNINTIVAGVPQLDIIYNGFELNLRYIPKLNYGDEFGDFGFYGIGLKHMFSKWFYEEENINNWRVAIQVAYQFTSLENTVGETNAELISKASIFNINLQTSKMIKNWFEIFGGVSYEVTNIDTKYEYTLPIEQQQALGLVDENKNVNPPVYPGDSNPQVANIPLEATNVKAIFGLNKSLGLIDIYAAYSVSQFNILSFGVAANF